MLLPCSAAFTNEGFTCLHECLPFAADVLGTPSKGKDLDGLHRSIAQLQRALAETFAYVDSVVVR